MKRSRFTLGLLTVGVLVLPWILSSNSQNASAQSGSRYQSGSGTRVQSGSSTRVQSRSGTTQSGGSGTRMVAQKPYEARFWDWMKEVQYRNWGPAPGQGEGAYEGQSPHGAFLKMYLNRKALANPKNPPVGSVIVKENYTADGKTLAAVTVMYKAKGYDPANGDWYYVKYNADGSVARTSPEKGSKKIVGKFASCIECHAGAAGGDYVFFND